MKQTIVVLLSMILLLSACGHISQDEKTLTSNESSHTIVFDHTLLGLSEADDLIDYFEENGSGQYINMEINSDGKVCMILSDGQQEYWENFAAQKLVEANEKLGAINSKYYYLFADDYITINRYVDIYADMALGSKDTLAQLAAADAYAAMYCVVYQMFAEGDVLALSRYIYNVDTGKLVAGGNASEGIEYDSTEWKTSYILTNDEAESLVQNYTGAEDVLMKSSFVDSISVIDIVLTAADNDYTYLYIDEDYGVHFGLIDEQIENNIQKLDDYLSALKSQFEGLGDNYEIAYDRDYSQIDFSFDADLSEDDQMSYIVYAETLCMALQVLNTGSEDYYIDINIYDSSTGELVSSGNTVDGISWNIGDK